ncbi:MAG: hypothetical protein AB7O97_06100 [Planctomycetota bacterium]
MFASTAEAQTPGLRNHYRIVNTVSAWTAPGGELRVDSGWVTAGPQTDPGANAVQSPSGCVSQGTCTTTSDYGELRVVGSGSCSSCGTGGAFLSLTDWSGGMPKAQFVDVLVVSSPSLPVGAPVQLLFAQQLSGFATATGTAPSVSYSAQLLVGGSALLTDTAPGGSTAIVHTTVGATLALHGKLNAILDGNVSPPDTGSYALDLRARVHVASWTAGVTLSSFSGAAYDGLAAHATAIGTGCGAAPPTLAATTPLLGSLCTLTTTGLPAGAPMFRALDAAGIALPSGPCVLRVDPATALVDFLGLASATGQHNSTLAIPSDGYLIGLAVTAQMVPLVPGGPFLGLAELSNGVELLLGP